MNIRKAIFWMHLCAGIAAGAFIFLMSATGVLLAFEKQILAFSEKTFMAIEASKTGDALSADEIAQRAQAQIQTDSPLTLTLFKRAGAAIKVQAGRGGQIIYINPYTGEMMEDRVHAIREIFNFNKSLHRWLALSGDGRAVGRAVTGASNLVFIFIILSGLYLWSPKLWRKAALRQRLFFREEHPSSKARDWNWHHVFGVWSLVPLFFIATTALVFSYAWASNLVYRAYGEEPPQRRKPSISDDTTLSATPASNLQKALDCALADAAGDWRTVHFSAPVDLTSGIDIEIDKGFGGRPSLIRTVSCDTATGALTARRSIADESPGVRAKVFIRFLHTGEVFDIWGQLVAALASLGACFLTYTGIALAFRRLVLPLLSRRKSNPEGQRRFRSTSTANTSRRDHHLEN